MSNKKVTNQRDKYGVTENVITDTTSELVGICNSSVQESNRIDEKIIEGYLSRLDKEQSDIVKCAMLKDIEKISTRRFESSERDKRRTFYALGSVLIFGCFVYGFNLYIDKSNVILPVKHVA